MYLYYYWNDFSMAFILNAIRSSIKSDLILIFTDSSEVGKFLIKPIAKTLSRS